MPSADPRGGDSAALLYPVFAQDGLERVHAHTVRRAQILGGPTQQVTGFAQAAAEIAQRLGDAGIFVWHGHYYALQITETLGLEPDGMVRIGLVHYNTSDEVDRFLQTLREL